MNVKDRINKIFASRVFYIIFSVLASLTIWLYVAYIENPDIPVTVSGIKIDLLHEDIITDRGLVITDISTDTVAIKLTGKRNIVTQVTNLNTTASVDLSAIDRIGVIPLDYTVKYPIDVNSSSFTTQKIVNYITVTVDNLVSKEIDVKCTYSGGVAEGYKDETPELTPQTITVSGPQEILSKISYAWVPVLRENISKTVDENLPFTLMDDNGHEVVSDQLTFSQDKIRVVIPVVMIKEVPLFVNLNYGAGADETNTDITISPAFLLLSGDAETLNNLNQIPLGLGPIDLTKFTNTTNIVLPIVLPNNTTNLTGLKEATVTVTISGLDSEHVIADNITLSNPAAGYTATPITKSVDITLRGTPEDIAKIRDGSITAANIRIVADLSEFSSSIGTHSVLAKVIIDGDANTIGAIGDYKVTFVITKD